MWMSVKVGREFSKLFALYLVSTPLSSTLCTLRLRLMCCFFSFPLQTTPPHVIGQLDKLIREVRCTSPWSHFAFKLWTVQSGSEWPARTRNGHTWPGSMQLNSNGPPRTLPGDYTPIWPNCVPAKIVGPRADWLCWTCCVDHPVSFCSRLGVDLGRSPGSPQRTLLDSGIWFVGMFPVYYFSDTLFYYFLGATPRGDQRITHGRFRKPYGMPEMELGLAVHCFSGPTL